MKYRALRSPNLQHNVISIQLLSARDETIGESMIVVEVREESVINQNSSSSNGSVIIASAWWGSIFFGGGFVVFVFWKRSRGSMHNTQEIKQGEQGEQGEEERRDNGRTYIEEREGMQ